MVGVTSTPMSEELPDGWTLVLDSSWDSSEGADVTIMKLSPDYEEQEELFYTEKVPREWHLGHFSDEDVRKEFGDKFNQILASERKKLERLDTTRYAAQKVLPKGPGSGWHKDHARHVAASKKGKRG